MWGLMRMHVHILYGGIGTYVKPVGVVGASVGRHEKEVEVVGEREATHERAQRVGPHQRHLQRAVGGGDVEAEALSLGLT